MKKLSIIAVLVAVGIISGFASAKSMSVPWFVDNAPAAAYYPPTSGTSALVYLHNNKDVALECSITYYSQTGFELALDDNTFSIPALSTVAFRPVATDPDTVPGGQESTVALAIPNRPTTDNKKNGAIVINWTGDSTDVQGLLTQGQFVNATSSTSAYYGKLAASAVTSWGTLLPPGAE